MTQIIISILIGLFGGSFAGYKICAFLNKKSAANSRRNEDAKRDDAERTAKMIIKNAEIRTKIELLKAKEDFEKATRGKRKEISEQTNNLSRREQILLQREENLDRKADMLEKKERNLDRKIEDNNRLREELKLKEADAEAKSSEADAGLSKLAAMTRDEAKRQIMETTRDELQKELGTLVRRSSEDAEKTAEKTARNILLNAMQRYAAPQTAETATRTVFIKNEDDKGKIIGREGRNIRAIEAVTGVTVMVDDTPDVIVLSSFDPLRRETAAAILEKLLASGRINPTRIEEVAAEVRETLDAGMLSAGSAACEKCSVSESDPEVLRAIGRMKFRTSFSQNIFDHAIEVSSIAGMIASQIGLDPDVARKAGLLHDIGKVMDQEHSGPHAAIGADFLRGHGEDSEVIDAVAGHHSETGVVTDYAALISVADAISSSRPGARSESTDFYLKRVEGVEKIASSFKSVKKAFAVHAGRELRVIVDPEKTSDDDAALLARDIAGRIQSELQFPGQIRVTVIREKRCTEFAR